MTEKYLSQEQGPLSRNHFEKKQNVEEEKCWRASCWQANVSSVNVGEQSGKEHLSYNRRKIILSLIVIESQKCSGIVLR